MSTQEHSPGEGEPRATEPRPSRTDRAVLGWFWMSSAAGVEGVVRIAVLAALARLLTPADFGSVAAGLLVINLTAMLVFALVGPALVQHPRLRNEHVEAAFSLEVLVALPLVGLWWLMASDVASLLGSDALEPVLKTLAFLLPIQALGAVPQALLRRDLEFGAVARIQMVSYGIGFGAVGISAALAGAGLWALVAASGAHSILQNLLLIRQKPHSRRLRLEPTALREILSFTGGFLLGRVGNYAAVNGDYFVIVRWLGVVALGVYERAYQLMAMPAVLVGQVIDDVLFPAMAQIQTDYVRVAQAFRRCVAGVALLTLPITALSIVLAPEIVAVVLGSQWTEVIVPFQILALGMLFRSSYKLGDSLARAMGAVYRRAWRQWAYAGLVIGGAIVGQRWGLSGVAVAVLFALGMNFFLMAHLSLRLVRMPWIQFLAAHGPAFRVALVVTLPAFTLAHLTRTVANWPALGVLVAVLAGTAALIGPVLVLRQAWFIGPDGRWLAEKLVGFVVKRVKKKRDGALRRSAQSVPDLSN